MGREEMKRHYEALELPPDAPLREVHAAFLRLKKLYSGGSIVLVPLGEEFPDKKRKKVLEQIEEAYARILASRKADSPRSQPLFSDVTPTETGFDAENLGGPFSGPLLRKLRERQGVELSEISKELKLRVELLRAIEEERFDALPEPIYLKVHLKSFAAFLRLDPTLVTDDYLRRYASWKSGSGLPD
jgi:curved DNA-binding protein CbpA